MSKVSVSFTTQSIALPAGVTEAPGHSAQLYLAAMPVGAPVAVPDGVLSFEMIVTVPGSYHIGVKRLDTSGNVIGSEVVCDPFVITAPQVVVPLAVTVTISA